MRRRRKLEAHAPRVLVIDLNDVDLVEFLDQTLRKGRLGRLVAEALDQLLRLLDFALLVGLGLALLFPNFIAQRQILVVRAGEVVALAQHNFQGARRRVVEEGSVVRNQNHRLRTIGQELLQPQDGLNVQVVRRFVQ